MTREHRGPSCHRFWALKSDREAKVRLVITVLLWIVRIGVNSTITMMPAISLVEIWLVIVLVIVVVRLRAKIEPELIATAILMTTQVDGFHKGVRLITLDDISRLADTRGYRRRCWRCHRESHGQGSRCKETL